MRKKRRALRLLMAGALAASLALGPAALAFAAEEAAQGGQAGVEETTSAAADSAGERQGTPSAGESDASTEPELGVETDGSLIASEEGGQAAETPAEAEPLGGVAGGDGNPSPDEGALDGKGIVIEDLSQEIEIPVYDRWGLPAKNGVGGPSTLGKEPITATFTPSTYGGEIKTGDRVFLLWNCWLDYFQTEGEFANWAVQEVTATLYVNDEPLRSESGTVTINWPVSHKEEYQIPTVPVLDGKLRTVKVFGPGNASLNEETLPFVEGAFIRFSTRHLSANETPEEAFSIYTSQPVYPFEGMEAINDPASYQDIPVINHAYPDNPAGFPTYGPVTAKGRLNGSNTPAGAKVCLSWNPFFGSATTMTHRFLLWVDGSFTPSDFGTIDLSIPVTFPEEYKGQTREVTIKTNDGRSFTSNVLLEQGASVSVPVTSMQDEYDPTYLGFVAHLSLGDEVTSVDRPIRVSGSTGITASGTLSGPSVPEGADVELAAEELTSGEAYDALRAAMGDGAFGGVFDVSMLVDGERVHDGFGELTLSFPVDAAYDGHWVTVWHLHQDGSVTSERVVAEGGFATVTVTDLSAFALEIGGPADAAEEAPAAGTPLAQTGDAAPAAALALAALAGAGALAAARRKMRA